MDIRFQHSPQETAGMKTKELRQHFLIDTLMVPGEARFTYTHYDRVVVGGIVPLENAIALPNPGELKADYFLQRREMGIINVGGTGTIKTNDQTFELEKLGCLYLGKGIQEVAFESHNSSEPAKYYLFSVPAHASQPNRKMTKDEASPVSLGDRNTSNERTIYKYIHNDGIQSCQIMMGLTTLKEGSIWNSVPPHTHTRRMEVYFYFDLHPDHRVMHFMGEPAETRHFVISNEQAVISAPWSMHFGVGTSSYGFIWAMAGENKEFTDMDQVPLSHIL